MQKHSPFFCLISTILYFIPVFHDNSTPSLSMLKVHGMRHMQEKMSFSISPWVYFGMLGEFILVFYKLLICQCERKILNRFGQQCMLSSIKWSLSASPAGIFSRDEALKDSFLMSLVVSLWFHSPSRTLQSLFFILGDLLWVLSLRTYVCVHLYSMGWKPIFFYGGNREFAKPGNMKCCPIMASLHIPPFMFLRVNQK